MLKTKSKAVAQAQALALQGDLAAMELLARRFFDGRGVEQCHLMSYIWASIATARGVKHLGSLSAFSFKKMDPEQVNNMPQQMAQTHSQLPPMAITDVA
ncbi:MAG TPA: hypothetical protein DE045_12365 [Oceanospirillaceae bacterium]|nr:hypothetical protein [Oceanospirillaceae bacterium]